MREGKKEENKEGKKQKIKKNVRKKSVQIRSLLFDEE
jgi:hypothetical protein